LSPRSRAAWNRGDGNPRAAAYPLPLHARARLALPTATPFFRPSVGLRLPGGTCVAPKVMDCDSGQIAHSRGGKGTGSSERCNPGEVRTTAAPSFDREPFACEDVSTTEHSNAQRGDSLNLNLLCIEHSETGGRRSQPNFYQLVRMQPPEGR